MIKYELLPLELIRSEGFQSSNFFVPDLISDDDIQLTHCTTYCSKLKSNELMPLDMRRIGFPWSMELIEREWLITSGTYQCALYAMEHQLAYNIAGGTHHAFKDKGEGFCLLNDQAVAANLLLKNFPNKVQRILIIDLDVHQGNGTASIFENNPNVFTFSMHGKNNFPFKKEKSNLDIELPDGIGDAEYIYLLEEALEKIESIFIPNFIFYQAGVDILFSDKLGKLKISMKGIHQRERVVYQFAKKLQVPIVTTMGGGYSESVKHIIEAHRATYSIGYNVLIG